MSKSVLTCAWSIFCVMAAAKLFNSLQLVGLATVSGDVAHKPFVQTQQPWGFWAQPIPGRTRRCRFPQAFLWIRQVPAAA